MLPMTAVTHEWLEVFAWCRLLIGVGFVTIAAQLLTIRHVLSVQLLFQRTVLVFSTFIGMCGVARVVEAAQLWQAAGHGCAITCPSGYIDYISLACDVLSAICAFSGTIAVVPITLNALGWHIQLKRL